MPFKSRKDNASKVGFEWDGCLYAGLETSILALQRVRQEYAPVRLGLE